MSGIGFLKKAGTNVVALKRVGKNWFSVRWTGERYDIRPLRIGQ